MYGANLLDFIQQDANAILGELTLAAAGDIETTQRNAWDVQIRLLKSLSIPEGLASQARIYFELTVPRLGRRADVVLLVGHVMFILEFKVGEASFLRSAIEQVWDYALDFKYFHEVSHQISIVPVLVATHAPDQELRFEGTGHSDGLIRPVIAAPSQISTVILLGLTHSVAPTIDPFKWEQGRYLPTPTIVEAARALYAGHRVEEISRSDAGAQNLTITAATIDETIERSRTKSRKTICFVTGVPGAGKTLVGLDIATRHLDPESATYSVFLSGNGPLVAVLREALVRDQVERALEGGQVVRKSNAKKKVETFIQNVHHFRDEYLRDSGAPLEHVVLFDEAQRAWNLEQTSAFMQRKKGKADFQLSEPEFLISCLDRHQDWCVVVCLVGGGQEINTGEGGIGEWFDAILRRFQGWDVYLSRELAASEYRGAAEFDAILARASTHLAEGLHLATSIRSFRAERVSDFVRDILDVEMASARETLGQLIDRYPIVLTRELSRAKTWLRQQARGSERYGIVVSSQAERLKPHAIDVRVKTDPVKWFLEGTDDTRSSYYLEDVATEFQVQGLELDWACVVWDGDLRLSGEGWTHHQFRGTRWQRINKPERQRYLENAYRVLLTRARQGMVLVVPYGDDEDPTRAPEIYDPTFDYLRSLGIRLI